MKRCLVDVNVMLALVVIQHEHHDATRRWFDGLAAGEAGLCRVVQLALVRLLANRAILGEHALTAASAWAVSQDLLLDERLEFIAEPPHLDSAIPALLHYPVPTAKLVTDAYLAAFAITTARRLVTLDRGFCQFRALDVHLL
jgi:hypothetical protein